jgi:hypothetical protein
MVAMSRRHHPAAAGRESEGGDAILAQLTHLLVGLIRHSPIEARKRIGAPGSHPKQCGTSADQ